jgi:WXG100 family type VII secretion target
MAVPRVRADYDVLGQIAKGFSKNPADSRKSMQRIKQHMEILQGGDWAGMGASAFYHEMNSAVLPGFNRLIASLEQAAQDTQKMSDIMKKAEEEAASYFRLDGGSVAAATSAGAAAAAAGAAGAAAAQDAAAGTVRFGTNAKQDAVSEYSRKVLQDIMNAAKLNDITITSTARSPYRQAVAMYDNLQSKGVASEKALYGPSGDKVIDVYVAQHAAGKSRDEIIGAMEAKINEIGPGKVSRHLADPSTRNVIDIAPSQIADKAAFEAAVAADSRVATFLKPPQDKAYHLEIPQPQK